MLSSRTAMYVAIRQWRRVGSTPYVTGACKPVQGCWANWHSWMYMALTSLGVALALTHRVMQSWHQAWDYWKDNLLRVVLYSRATQQPLTC